MCLFIGDLQESHPAVCKTAFVPEGLFLVCPSSDRNRRDTCNCLDPRTNSPFGQFPDEGGRSMFANKLHLRQIAVERLPAPLRALKRRDVTSWHGIHACDSVFLPGVWALSIPHRGPGEYQQLPVPSQALYRSAECRPGNWQGERFQAPASDRCQLKQRASVGTDAGANLPTKWTARTRRFLSAAGRDSTDG